MATQTQQMAANTAQLGGGVPLCYGPIHATGNLVGGPVTFSDPTYGDGTRAVLYLLGEGEWDGIDQLYVNRALFDFTDTTKCHFHPGTDGAIGTGSVGGDQEGDGFLSLFDLDPQLTFSRTAYIALKVPPDPDAPTDTLEVLGYYRSLKVRTFDSLGNQTGYAYSLNHAWHIHDLILRVWVKRQALINAPLTALERARFDFSSFAETAAYNDELINGSKIKRFEGGAAFIDKQSASDALDQLLLVSRSYIREVNGVIQLRSDKPRSAAFFLTAQHVDLNTLMRPNKSDLVGAANQFTGNLLDIEGFLADIAPTSTQGLKRVSGIVTCLCLSEPAAAVGDKVGVDQPDSATFEGDQFTVTARPTANTLQWAQSGADEISGGGILFKEELRFTSAAPVLNHEANQDAKGVFGAGIPAIPQEVNLDLDCGNNTTERVRRLLYFQKTRSLGIDQKPYSAPWQISIDAFMESLDKNGNSLLAVRPGDVINVDGSIMDELAGDYELLPMVLDLGGLSNQVNKFGSQSAPTAAPPMFNLSLKAMVPEAFVDILPEDDDEIELPPPGVLATQFQFANAADVDMTIATIPPGFPEEWMQTVNTSHGFPLTGDITGVPDNNYRFVNCLNAEAFTSRWLRASDFRFVVPAGATIVGYQAQWYIRWFRTGLSSRVADAGMQLIHAGSYIGTDQSLGEWPDVPVGFAPRDNMVRTTGGSGNNWGASLTGANVMDTSFGVAMRLALFSALASPPIVMDVEAQVDAVALRLFYTP